MCPVPGSFLDDRLATVLILAISLVLSVFFYFFVK